MLLFLEVVMRENLRDLFYIGLSVLLIIFGCCIAYHFLIHFYTLLMFGKVGF